MRISREQLARLFHSDLVRRLRKPRNVLLLLVVILFLAWFFTLRPTFLGGSTSYIIVSGSSMEPTMSDCDLAVLHERDSYEVGDVIAYRIPDGEIGAGLIVIHRIVGGSADDGYITRGDSTNNVDRWRPHRDDVLGELSFHIPNVGCVLTVLREPLVIGVIAGLFAALVVLESDRFSKRGA